MTTREPVPAAVQREIRQRAGHGCVICGLPVYDYEHILGYSVTGHDPEHMTLLCKAHHGEKTAGRLPVEVVVEANRRPFNRWNPAAKGQRLYVRDNGLEVVVGRTSFWPGSPGASTTIFKVDGVTLLGMRVIDGVLSPTLLVRDEANRRLVQIRDGHLAFAGDAWDVTLVGRTLRVWTGPRRIAVELELQPPSRIVIKRVELWLNGIRIRAGGPGFQDSIVVGGGDPVMTVKVPRVTGDCISAGNIPEGDSAVLAILCGRSPDWEARMPRQQPAPPSFRRS